MYYPFKCKDLLLREKLINEKIYSPTWWRHVPNQIGVRSVESGFSLETVLLPIDQRYCVEDMKYLSEKVIRLLE